MSPRDASERTDPSQRIDRAVHELHQAELAVREGRPVDAATLRRIREELVELKARLYP
jgi:hypothetical protein